MDIPKEEVKFLLHEKNSDLFAYFPNIEARFGGYKLAYSEIGQHSSCHPLYTLECREATKEEYQELEQELIQAGYNLKVLNK